MSSVEPERSRKKQVGVKGYEIELKVYKAIQPSGGREIHRSPGPGNGR